MLAIEGDELLQALPRAEARRTLDAGVNWAELADADAGKAYGACLALAAGEAVFTPGLAGLLLWNHGRRQFHFEPPDPSGVIPPGAITGDPSGISYELAGPPGSLLLPNLTPTT